MHSEKPGHLFDKHNATGSLGGWFDKHNGTGSVGGNVGVNVSFPYIDKHNRTGKALLNLN